METRLIDKNWGDELAALAKNSSSLRIICPFIKTKALEYLQIERQEKIQVITRFNEHDFFNGVSDIAALHQLLESGAEIRGVWGLHSKVYLFGETHAVVTSANLTQSAMTSNHEFGVISEDAEIIGECHEYFDGLWERAGDNFTHENLIQSDEAVKREKDATGEPRKLTNLKDKGFDVHKDSRLVPKIATTSDSGGPQAFIKFFGGSVSGDRVPLSSLVIDQIKYSDCHWAVCSSVHPRMIKDGATIFIGRMTKDPDDITIFGCAIGLEHDEKRDVANSGEIERVSWKKEWAYYTRVHDVEFVRGSLENGVSLSKMEDALEHDTLWPTQKNYREGNTGTNPKKMHRLVALQLTHKSSTWLQERLQTAFYEHGKMTESDLRKTDGLDWPDLKKLGLG